MKTSIDAAGRIVVPVALRNELKLSAGQPLEVRLRNGVLEIEPIALPVKLHKAGRFVVAGVKGRPALTTDAVTKTRTLQRERQR